jgi:predicted NBD/HSP70 family sugar kinase
LIRQKCYRVAVPALTWGTEGQPLSASQYRLIALLEQAGPLSRSELADLSGMPRTTVTGVVGKLLRRSLVTEGAPAPLARGAGRPPRLVAVGTDQRLVAVLTRVRGGLRAALATFAGEVVAESSEEVAWPAHDLGSLLEPATGQLTTTLREAGLPAERVVAAVLSIPHPGRPSHTTARLEERLEIPVFTENDANMGALGEATFGAGRGLGSLIHVMLGHNVGAGIVVGGRLHRGASGYAGELAHVRVQDEGALCTCGGRGCLSTVVGPSLLDFIQRAYAERLGVAEVLALAAEREPGVRRVFADLGRTVGRPLADLCTMLDPAVVVVDGSLGAATAPVIDGIRESIDRFAAPVVADSVRVVPGQLAERAEILGGVALLRQRSLGAGFPSGDTA